MTFDGYHATSILRPGDDAQQVMAWKRDYFTYYYAPHLPRDRHAAIGDVGAGFGPYLHTLRGLGYTNATGVDLGAEQVAYARDTLGLEIDHGDGVEWLTARPGHFDCILLFDVVEHLEVDHLVAMSHALADALKPGGTVIVQAPNGLAPFNDILHGDLTHRRGFTARSLRQFLAIGGLEPTAFLELGPFPQGWRTNVHRAVWRYAAAPVLRLAVRVVHGNIEAPILTPNLAVVATKPS